MKYPMGGHPDLAWVPECFQHRPPGWTIEAFAAPEAGQGTFAPWLNAFAHALLARGLMLAAAKVDAWQALAESAGPTLKAWQKAAASNDTLHASTPESPRIRLPIGYSQSRHSRLQCYTESMNTFRPTPTTSADAALIAAVLADDAEAVAAALRAGAPSNLTFDHGTGNDFGHFPALAHAIVLDHTSATGALLAGGADPVDCPARPPLHLALSSPLHIAIVRGKQAAFFQLAASCPELTKASARPACLLGQETWSFLMSHGRGDWLERLLPPRLTLRRTMSLLRQARWNVSADDVARLAARQGNPHVLAQHALDAAIANARTSARDEALRLAQSLGVWAMGFGFPMEKPLHPDSTAPSLLADLAGLRLARASPSVVEVWKETCEEALPPLSVIDEVFLAALNGSGRAAVSALDLRARYGVPPPPLTIQPPPRKGFSGIEAWLDDLVSHPDIETEKVIAAWLTCPVGFETLSVPSALARWLEKQEARWANTPIQISRRTQTMSQMYALLVSLGGMENASARVEKLLRSHAPDVYAKWQNESLGLSIQDLGVSAAPARPRF